MKDIDIDFVGAESRIAVSSSNSIRDRRVRFRNLLFEMYISSDQSLISLDVTAVLSKYFFIFFGF